jgi:hypothetical protein
MDMPLKMTAADHRERACHCVRLAQELADAGGKTLLLDMAQVWIRLAETLEGLDDTAGNGLDTVTSG